MKNKPLGRKLATIAVVSALLAQLASCGTILYPERRGQAVSGRIDPQVAILNGIGLLFMVVPGVIAFGVDFVTGAIYLPGKKTALLLTPKQKEAIQLNGTLDMNALERIIQQETDLKLDLNSDEVAILKMDNLAELDTKLAQYSLM